MFLMFKSGARLKVKASEDYGPAAVVTRRAADRLRAGHLWVYGSDIEALVADGVPALSPRTVEAHYFDWHHTEADTLDKVDPAEFKKNAAMLSVVTYVLADMDGRLVGHKSAAAE